MPLFRSPSCKKSRMVVSVGLGTPILKTSALTNHPQKCSPLNVICFAIFTHAQTKTLDNPERPFSLSQPLSNPINTHQITRKIHRKWQETTQNQDKQHPKKRPNNKQNPKNKQTTPTHTQKNFFSARAYTRLSVSISLHTTNYISQQTLSNAQQTR